MGVDTWLHPYDHVDLLSIMIYYQGKTKHCDTLHGTDPPAGTRASLIGDNMCGVCIKV